MTAATAAIGRVLPLWGTTAQVVVTDPGALAAAQDLLLADAALVDAACSRFRPDSEISRAHVRPGRPVRVGPVLGEALTVAFRVAATTGGLVDPTVGAAVVDLGYDRDFTTMPLDRPDPAAGPRPAPGWQAVGWDPEHRCLTVPSGVLLDLGATAKALAADRIADRIARRLGCGALVSLGGDVGAAGPAPLGGWAIGVGDDHETARTAPDTVMSIVSGGLATSGTVRRAWCRAGRAVHHIADPRTGDVAAPCWRTVTVAAASCLDANAASTAAVVLGPEAPAWLARLGLPARLVAVDGIVTTTADWPAGEDHR